MTVMTFLIIWWITGFVLIELGLFLNKENFFSETEEWTLGMLALEILLSILGPIMLFPLYGMFLKDKVDYMSDRIDDFFASLRDYPLKNSKPKDDE